MRILIITNHYLDGRGGGTTGSRGFINAFASIYPDCLLIYPDNGHDVSNILRPGIKMIGCRDNRPKWLKAAGIYFGKLHRFASIVKRTIEDYKPGIVVFDSGTVSSRLIRYVKDAGIKIITIHHNIEKEYFHDNPPSLLIRFPYHFYISRAERDAVNMSDLNLTLTESDANKLMKYYSGVIHPPIKCIGVLGTETEKPAQNILKRENVRNTKSLFIMTGSLGFRQSDSSFIGFIENYLPVLLEKCEKAELIIGGSNPSGRLVKACGANENIRLIKNPVNLLEVVLEGDVYICPVDKGSGLKLRIADGLKAGIPVLAHEISARGYEYFVETGAIHTYNSVPTFIESLNEILVNETDRKERIAQYLTYFSAESGIARLKALIDPDFT